MLPAAVTVILFGLVIAVAMPAIWMRVSKIERGLAELANKVDTTPLWRKI